MLQADTAPPASRSRRGEPCFDPGGHEGAYEASWEGLLPVFPTDSLWPLGAVLSDGPAEGLDRELVNHPTAGPVGEHTGIQLRLGPLLDVPNEPTEEVPSGTSPFPDDLPCAVSGR